MRAVLLTSVTTGVFCAIFAVVVDMVTDALNMGAVIALAFVSGFLGSLFGHIVVKKQRQDDEKGLN